MFTLIVVLQFVPEDGIIDRSVHHKYKDDSSVRVESDQIKTFASEEEFKAYLSKAMDMADFNPGFGFSSGDALSDASVSAPVMPSAPGGSPGYGSTPPSPTPERYSETNIQVEGVDEPDIVKTDGVNIYVSSERFDHGGGTKIVGAFPVESLSLINGLDESGRLFLKEDILVIIGADKVLGYDVADPKDPELKWEMDINERTGVDNARLYGDKIYFVISNRVIREAPCVFEPLLINESPLVVSCLDIHYPETVVPADTIYTLLKVDLLSGEKDETLSFVGSAKNSIVYMSPENFYLSYFKPLDFADFLLTFFVEEFDDLFPDDIILRLENLSGYDIGSEAKMVELMTIFEDFFEALTRDEELELEERFEERLLERLPVFYGKRKFELDHTGIIKVGIDNLKIEALGIIPGRLLNQFAMDEYQGNLRVATTIGEEAFWMFGPEAESSNEVHVLDGNLRQKGVVGELGLGERIYSVRFIEDKGYVVTFREIDPFYIIDLSDPNDPKMKGELKIPGYSSYLHPIDERYMLGIGREGRSVKASLFDISDPYDPKETDKYILPGDSWSEALGNHHAFLLDPLHEVFFLPTRNRAHIFSYEGGKLELIKTIGEAQIRRALYIDDHLYVIRADKILVFDQNTWEKIKELGI